MREHNLIKLFKINKKNAFDLYFEKSIRVNDINRDYIYEFLDRESELEKED